MHVSVVAGAHLDAVHVVEQLRDEEGVQPHRV